MSGSRLETPIRLFQKSESQVPSHRRVQPDKVFARSSDRSVPTPTPVRAKHRFPYSQTTWCLAADVIVCEGTPVVAALQHNGHSRIGLQPCSILAPTNKLRLASLFDGLPYHRPAVIGD